MFKQGESGNPAGRPKGAKGKLKRVVAALEDLGLNPLADLLTDINLVDDPEARAKLRLELMAYVYAKPKEQTIAAESPEESVERVADLAKQLEDLSKPINPENTPREIQS